MTYFYSRYLPSLRWLILVILYVFIPSSGLKSQNIALNTGKNSLKITANDYSKLSLSSTLSNFNFININTSAGVFSELIIKSYGYSYNIGSPKLPVLRKLIEIPVGANITVNIINQHYIDYSLAQLGIQYPIIPSQQHVSKDTIKKTAEFIVNKSVYSVNDFIKVNPSLVSVDYLGIMRGVSLARLNISPVEYNPVTKSIRVYDIIEVDILFNNADITKTIKLKGLYNSPQFSSAYKSIINYKAVGNKENGVLSKSISHQAPVKYVIVSDPIFRDALQTFIKWKKKKGFTVIEAYTDDPAVGSTNTSIRAYLKNLYKAATPADPAPSFILIVGDVEQVPPFKGVESSNYYFTDLYYGEYTGDLIPETFYGRFSANNLAELQPQIDKTLEYEQYLMPDPTYLNNAILTAGIDVNYAGLYANGQMNYASANYFNAKQGYNTFYYKYPLSALAKQKIKLNINDGVGFANYSGHGTFTSWVNPTLTVSDIANMTNKGKYPLMIGNACFTQAFDQSVSFGESLLRASEKGAIGYIGASSESYWDEDFWWSTGFGTIDTLPDYGSTKLGAYDRLFHKHNEPYSDWFTTQGEILSAGNLAVMQSGSPDYKYYWEVYNLMGDPSLTPYLTQPLSLNITYDNIQPMNINSVNFKTEPFTYIAISHNDTLLGAAFADSNGIANVNITSVSDYIHANVIATKQNRIPYSGSITFVKPGSAFIIENSMKIHGSKSYNNKSLNFGERIKLDVNLKNIGIKSAVKVTAKLSAEDKYIKMTDSISSFGSISSNDSITVTNAYSFQVDSLVPDQHSVVFKLLITDSIGNNWTSYFIFPLNSPAFTFNKHVINDFSTDKSVIKLQQGQTADIIIPTINSGHVIADSVTGRLSTLNEDVTINNYSFDLKTIKIDSTANAKFNITVSPDAPEGSTIKFTYIVITGSYMFIKIINVIVGSANEDFVAGNFSKFNWENKDNYPWVMSDNSAYSGTYCARSGYINGNGQSQLTISFNIDMNDTISFYSKTKIDTSCNSFQFWVDDTRKVELTESQNWSRSSIAVGPGYHTFKWIFIKNSENSYNNDCAWIDYINFPHFPTSISEFAETSDIDFQFYPNPFTNNANISFNISNESTVNIKIYNSIGEIVNTIYDRTNASAGNYTLTIKDAELKAGMYYIVLQSGKNKYTKRILKLMN